MIRVTIIKNCIHWWTVKAAWADSISLWISKTNLITEKTLFTICARRLTSYLCESTESTSHGFFFSSNIVWSSRWHLGSIIVYRWTFRTEITSRACNCTICSTKAIITLLTILTCRVLIGSLIDTKLSCWAITQKTRFTISTLRTNITSCCVGGLRSLSTTITHKTSITSVINCIEGRLTKKRTEVISITRCALSWFFQSCCCVVGSKWAVGWNFWSFYAVFASWANNRTNSCNILTVVACRTKTAIRCSHSHSISSIGSLRTSDGIIRWSCSRWAIVTCSTNCHILWSITSWCHDTLTWVSSTLNQDCFIS